VSDRPPDELAERRRTAVTRDIARGVRHPRKRAFLEAYATSGNITLAAESAGVGRATHYVWMRDDPAYAEAARIAKEISCDLLEAALRQRGMGWTEPILNAQGEVVGHHRRYDTTSAIFLLKGARPHVYRERYEHSGPDGGPIPVEHRIEDIVAKLRAARGLPENVIDVEEA
jgi:hypothetical protein